MVTVRSLPSGNLGSIEEGRQAEPSVVGAHEDHTEHCKHVCVWVGWGRLTGGPRTPEAEQEVKALGVRNSTKLKDLYVVLACAAAAHHHE